MIYIEENVASLFFACHKCHTVTASEINPILPANPFHRPWRQNLCGCIHSETCQSIAVAGKPSTESSATHPSSLSKFIFIYTFHSFYFSTKLRKNLDICKRNTLFSEEKRTQADRSGQRLFQLSYLCSVIRNTASYDAKHNTLQVAT